MVQKALLAIKLLAVAIVYCLFTGAINSCNTVATPAQNKAEVLNYGIDTSNIPHDTILANAPKLLLQNGYYYVGNQPYSGIVKSYHSNGRVKMYVSVYKGMLHGRYLSFYEDGQPYEVRLYRNNLSTGRQYGYWPNSNHLKFDYNYYEEKREGVQKKWYSSGKPYIFAHYNNDHEAGLQQAWRENGKLYLNYVAKDGHTYGLQQSALCYTLINQAIKTR